MTSATTTFVEATSVKQLTSHTYAAEFPDDWCIGSVPHGGFVTSTFLTVARDHFNTTLSSQNQPDTITLHLDFLRRTNAGPALFTVKDVKLGRQTSILHITLTQGSETNPREEVVGYITNTNIASEKGISYTTGWELQPSPVPADLAKLRDDKDLEWARQGSMPFAKFRKASSKVHFHFPRSGQPSKHIADTWLSFRNGERFTNETLGFMSDMFPMPVEAFLEDDNPYDVRSAGKKVNRRVARFWYPTLLLNLDIKKRLPKEGVEWLFSRCTTKRIKNGRTDLEIVIMDESGDVVALSNHVTLVLDAERNLAQRSTDGGKDSKI